MPTLARYAPVYRRGPKTLAWIDAMFQTHRQRIKLSDLDPHLRRDIGLSDSEIEAESRRKFWDVPNWWR